MWDLFSDRETGFFVEAGAYDGYTFSVSYLFECAGWAGVLVEPLPDRAAECARRRPGSRVVVTALTRPGAATAATFTRVAPYEMYSTLELTEGHAARLERDHQATTVSTVSTMTLDSVLDGHSGPIDFIVLDVEGHELSVLEGFDLDRWRPAALLVEDNSNGRDRAVRQHVQRHGYRHVASLAHNDLFVHEGQLSLVRRLEGYWDDLGPLGR